MLRQITLALFLLAAPINGAFAADWQNTWFGFSGSHEQDKVQQVAIIHFNAQESAQHKIVDALSLAEKTVPDVQIIALEDESKLTQTLEKLAEGNIGLVVIIAPHDMETVSKLPALYPDIHFSLVDIPSPFYMANVQSVSFKEEEGAFLLGAIAALKANKRISYLALENNDQSRILNTSFISGAREANPAIKVNSIVGIKTKNKNAETISDIIDLEFSDGSEVIFSPNMQIMTPLLHAATSEKRYVEGFDIPPQQLKSPSLLTYMIKRYDLVLMNILLNYQKKQWRPGAIAYGVNAGYMDYSFNSANVEFMPRDIIDRIETIKDYVAQGMLK